MQTHRGFDCVLVLLLEHVDDLGLPVDVRHLERVHARFLLELASQPRDLMPRRRAERLELVTVELHATEALKVRHVHLFPLDLFAQRVNDDAEPRIRLPLELERFFELRAARALARTWKHGLAH